MTFHGELRPEQQLAADAMLEHETGVFSRDDGFWQDGGRRLAHRTTRRQYAGPGSSPATARSMGRAPLNVSRFARKVDRTNRRRTKQTDRVVDVAVIQSLVRNGVVDDCVGDYGHVIVDECHHLSAHSFEQVVRRAKARFVTGLSATVARKDGHHPIIFMQCGPVRHRVDAKAQAAARPFEHTVIVRPTAFSASDLGADKRVEFQALYQLWWTTRPGIEHLRRTRSGRE